MKATGFAALAELIRLKNLEMESGMNRDAFFKGARAILGGALKQSQVDGLTLILDEYKARLWKDDRHLAYILATVHHETARTFQPIREFGRGSGKKYGERDPITGETYYGRGYVQLTWKENYRKAADKIGVPLVNHPDLAMVPANAVRITFDGMAEGWFAGDSKGRHDLTRYFRDGVDDPVGARRIINGQDKAREIADLHAAYLKAIVGG